jgi:uncharacterized protein (DUF1800 family)
MLIAIMTILFLGGGGGMLDYISDTRGMVKEVMPKDDAREEALAVLKSMKVRAKSRNKVTKQARKDLGKAFENHAVQTEEIDAIWNANFDDADTYRNEMLDLRCELKQYISREEWQEIFSETREIESES